MRGFERAFGDGADGIELDIRPCRSGELVVIHDITLDRVAQASVNVIEATIDELQSHDVGAGERIPRLDDALALTRERGRLVNIEIKADGIDSAAFALLVDHVFTAVIRSRLPRPSVRITSFHQRVVELLALRAEEESATEGRVSVGQLAEANDAGLALLDEAARRGLHVHPNHRMVTKTRVEAWGAVGARTAVWTVNDLDVADAMKTAGVDAVITDDPGALRRHWAERSD